MKCTLIDNKRVDEEEGEDLHRILEGAKFDVEEMMDLPSLIKDDERESYKLPHLMLLALRVWQPVRGA